jgi:hypothetical protein
MNENPEPSLIDYDQLKREITAAVRAVIQERADELGISSRLASTCFSTRKRCRRAHRNSSDRHSPGITSFDPP